PASANSLDFCSMPVVNASNDLTVRPLPNSLPLEDRRQALSYPEAERRDAARGAGASHLVDQRRGQAGAAATKRVTNRNRAAVDVQFCVVDAQLALAGEGLRGERLVQLEQVDAVERQFRAQKRLAHRGHGSEPHERGIDAGRGARTDEGDRL